MVIGSLQEKKPYEIQFTANDGSPADLYVILAGWVPQDGGGPLPPDAENELGPGESCQIPGTAPAMADARRLRIEVSVPHPTGGGTLTVTQGSASTYDVTDDVTFLSPLRR